MYKKVVIVIGVCLFFVTACTNDNKDTPQKVLFFDASIMQIDGDLAIVSSDLGEIVVDLSVNKQTQFEVGDQIKVGYDGEIKESFPAQITTLSVERIE